MTTTVALEQCASYDFDAVYSAVCRLLDEVPPPDVAGKTVLLKPNILYPKKPDDAVCTHPVVVGAAVKAFVARGARKVIVGESPAIANSTAAAKATGMYAQVVENGGEWSDFSGHVTVPCPDGKIVKQLEFAAPFAEADVVVSLAKLKSHQFMSYTGAMKNMFGLMVGLEKAQTHYRFPAKKDFGAFLTDLNSAAHASYAIMDAVVGMDGPGGPGSGRPIHLGFLAASDNLLALDWECSSLVGYNPHDIVNLEDALSRKRWLTSPDEITTAGCSPDSVRSTTFQIVREPAATIGGMMPKWFDSVAKFVLTRNPHFHQNKCLRCGRCASICPAHIITMTGKNGAAAIGDRSKCLHCFCCHEICPGKAISLRRF